MGHNGGAMGASMGHNGTQWGLNGHQWGHNGTQWWHNGTQWGRNGTQWGPSVTPLSPPAAGGRSPAWCNSAAAPAAPLCSLRATMWGWGGSARPDGAARPPAAPLRPRGPPVTVHGCSDASQAVAELRGSPTRVIPRTRSRRRRRLRPLRRHLAALKPPEGRTHGAHGTYSQSGCFPAHRAARTARTANQDVSPPTARRAGPVLPIRAQPRPPRAPTRGPHSQSRCCSRRGPAPLHARWAERTANQGLIPPPCAARSARTANPDLAAPPWRRTRSQPGADPASCEL